MVLNNPWNHILSAENFRKTASQKTYMRKEKFGKKEKSHKCTYCNKPGTRIKFGKEVRTLCKDHLAKLNAKHQEIQVNNDTFKKANQL